MFFRFLFWALPAVLSGQVDSVKIVSEVEGEYFGDVAAEGRLFHKLNLFHVEAANYFCPDSSMIYVSYSIGDTSAIYKTGGETALVFDEESNQWLDLTRLKQNVLGGYDDGTQLKFKRTGKTKKILGNRCRQYILKSKVSRFKGSESQEVAYYWIAESPDLLDAAKQMDSFNRVFTKYGIVLERTEDYVVDGVVINRRRKVVRSIEIE